MLLLFDIGATNTRVALASDYKLTKVVKFATNSSTNGFDDFLTRVDNLLSSVDHLDGVCGGLPGHLEGPDGRLILAPNLPNWIGLPVMREMGKRFNCSVHVMNDVMIGGLGESHYGAGITRGVMAYFTISTGVN